MEECLLYKLGSQHGFRRLSMWIINYVVCAFHLVINKISHSYTHHASSSENMFNLWSLVLISVFVVDFDARAQASDFRIERRQAVFLCWMQDSNLGSLEPNLHQTKYEIGPPNTITAMHMSPNGASTQPDNFTNNTLKCFKGIVDKHNFKLHLVSVISIITRKYTNAW